MRSASVSYPIMHISANSVVKEAAPRQCKKSKRVERERVGLVKASMASRQSSRLD